MPRIFPPNVPPSAVRTMLWLSVVSLLLSGCFSHSLVSNDELEADRQKRQALQTRQAELLANRQELLEQIVGLTSAQGELETRLATAEARRDALETRQIELEQYLQEQQSAVEGVQRLTLQLEQWREQDLARQSAMSETRYKDDAELYLQLLEKKGQLARLSDELGEAILEVVRTKAKLRSLESRAEAASDLAEAEIAIEALLSQGEVWETDPAVIKARELSELSAREFEQGNYGGALYLTGQAKNVIKGAEVRSVNRETRPLVDGEKTFVTPLPLLLVSDSALRKDPGDQSTILLSLLAGTDLTGYSYKGRWVRVKTAGGVSGWVFYRDLGSAD